MEIRKAVAIGLTAGLLWSAIALLWTLGSQAWLGGTVVGLEKGTMANILPFVVGGIVMAGLCWSLLLAWGRSIPFGGSITKGIAITVAVWVFLTSTGPLVASAASHRVYFNAFEVVQGALLAVVLGMILGILKDRYNVDTSS